MENTTKSKRQKTTKPCCSETCDKNELIKIPENILLEIFKYLPVKDRCVAGSVCKKWRRIVKDNSLWRHVNLLDYRLDLPKMWKVLRAHFSPCLLTMKIQGFAHTGSSKWKKASISDAMLKELSTRCPNLWHLHLHDCNTDNLSFESLPPSITSLSITYSTWQPRWFKGKHSHLPKLEHLDLSSTVRLDNYDLEDIAQWSNLKSLSLKGCYRIQGSEIEVIAKNLAALESLDVGGTCLDNLAIHHLSRHLKRLKELYVANCPGIDDSSLATITTGLLKLHILDISDCDKVTIDGLRTLTVLQDIKVLIVKGKNKLQDAEVVTLKKLFSKDIVIKT
ncbi:unnamed protein product [Lymnaea stagnalis]|uniref:F-box domain-containing protein n=1 Tax=Lymnaea stagnalis TaxID=6523 RepID=A0AAV2IKG7_LYMST